MLKYPRLKELWKDQEIKDEIIELVYNFGQGDCYGVACSKYCCSMKSCGKAQEKAIDEMLLDEKEGE